jgi:hypothetical protein
LRAGHQLPAAASPAGRVPGARRWLPPLALAGMAALLLCQGLAYYSRLALSLGPRVVLEPWLLRNGFVLYEQAADIHTPLMPLLLAALAPLAADGLVLARMVLVALLSLSTLLAFLAGRRAGGWLGGLWAAWFFVAWSPAFGFGKLWHETFLAPLYMLLLLLYDPAAARRPVRTSILLGLVCGVAILVKQYAALVLAALVAWDVLRGWRAGRSPAGVLQDASALCLGAILPVLAFAASQYLRAGTLRGFLYWTAGYALTSQYGSLAAQWPTLAQVGVMASSGLLLPAAVTTAVGLWRKGDRAWLSAGWGLLLLAASSATVYPRFALFHLQAALPVLSWLSAWTLSRALRPGSQGRTLATGTALVLSAFWLLVAGSAYVPALRVGQPPKISEYSDLLPLAAQVEAHIGPADLEPAALGLAAPIYIFPDDEATSNLYYLLERLPPRFWTFTYPWYSEGWMKDRVLAALKERPPEWVVYFPRRRQIETYAPEIVAYLHERYELETRLDWAQGETWLLRRRPQ